MEGAELEVTGKGCRMYRKESERKCNKNNSVEEQERGLGKAWA